MSDNPVNTKEDIIDEDVFFAGSTPEESQPSAAAEDSDVNIDININNNNHDEDEESPPEPKDTADTMAVKEPPQPSTASAAVDATAPPPPAAKNPSFVQNDDAVQKKIAAEEGQDPLAMKSPVEFKDVEQQDAAKNEAGEEGGGGGDDSKPKPKKQESQREVNKDFQDVQKTGKWGNISQTEKIGVGVFVLAAIVAIIVAVVLVTGKDDSPKEENVPAATQAPTPMATSMPADEKFPLILKEIYDNPVTASKAQTMPDVPSYYAGKMDDAAGCAEMPHECAMSWVLYEDEFLTQTNNIVYRYALAALYYSMGGPNWKNNTNWLTSTSYCQWYGVNCNRLETEVRDLELGDNNLKGEIPPELSLIDSIAGISMKENQISGNLPGDTLASLPLLFFLYLQDNLLTGPIPDNLINQNESLGTYLLINEKRVSFWFATSHFFYLLTYLLTVPFAFPISLAVLYIHDNNFTGAFPANYCEGDDGAVFRQFSLDCSKNACPAECCFSENCF